MTSTVVPTGSSGWPRVAATDSGAGAEGLSLVLAEELRRLGRTLRKPGFLKDRRAPRGLRRSSASPPDPSRKSPKPGRSHLDPERRVLPCTRAAFASQRPWLRRYSRSGRNPRSSPLPGPSLSSFVGTGVVRPPPYAPLSVVALQLSRLLDAGRSCPRPVPTKATSGFEPLDPSARAGIPWSSWTSVLGCASVRALRSRALATSKAARRLARRRSDPRPRCIADGVRRILEGPVCMASNEADAAPSV